MSASRKINGLAFYYFNKDHLGSNREVIYENGKISQVTNYYPFGTPYCDNVSTINSDNQPFKYNGKEFDKMYGLNTFDYGGRQYNSIVPTWDRIDPLAEKYYNVSPYAYCADNPVNAVDPDGKEIQYFLLTLDRGEADYLIQNNKTMENVLKAIGIIRQTDYGSNFFNSFEKGGANFAYKLDINTTVLNSSQTSPDNLPKIFGNSDLDYDDENDRIKFELTVDDSEKSVGEILQTICHEISDHLNTPNINSAINVFEKNGKGKNGFDKAHNLFYKDSAHKQHRQQDEHQGNPWKYYEQLMDQIIKRHPEYKEDFENGMNNNHENVLNEE
jgi:RHS repeat-associated protein